MGSVLAESNFDGETIRFADLGRRMIVNCKYDLDVVGHHARSDIFKPAVDTSTCQAVVFGSEGASDRNPLPRVSRMKMSQAESNLDPGLRQFPLDRVVAHQRKFLSFLRMRVEDAATAEDILQSAYLKAMEHGAEIRDDESAVAWFYRILRNAIVDHYRRGAARARAHEGFASEAPASYEPELAQTVCACIGDVVHNLKDEYRSAIEQVDLGGKSVEDFAQTERISANNASVRLHRARKAIARQLTTVCGACAEHQCLDCTCRRSQV